jgi:hypothetical protein
MNQTNPFAFPSQVKNAMGTSFVYNAPSFQVLGNNAYYQETFGGGIADALSVEVCFEKSGAIAFVDWGPSNW